MNKDFLEKIYALKNIHRFNNINRITDESVAEHSFFVAAIVLDLSKDFKFNVDRAIKLAIVHDYHEIYTGDIVSSAKRLFKDLKETMAKVEIDIAKKYFKDESDLLIEISEMKTIESKIVQLADLYSVLQYTSNELKLGSNPEMKKIFDNTQEKVNNLIEEIGGSFYKRK